MARRILIVDDDPIVRELVAAALQPRDCIVDGEENGELGLASLRQRRRDLVLLDASMPVLDGFQTLIAMKEDGALRHIPVIMLTASRSESDVRRALALGATDYLAKPFESNSLFERVDRVLSSLS